MRIGKRSIIVIIVTLNRYRSNPVVIKISKPTTIAKEIITHVYTRCYHIGIEIYDIDAGVGIELISDDGMQGVRVYLAINAIITRIEYVSHYEPALRIV
jgi:hypothetical protein